MITGDCNFPYASGIDLASAGGIRNLAEQVDATLLSQEQEIDYLERPEVVIVKNSSSTFVDSSYSNGYPITFDELRYTSRPDNGLVLYGLHFPESWRSGIYHVGMFLDSTVSGTVYTSWADMNFYDKRGARFQNQYTETSRHVGYTSMRGAIALTISGLLEVHCPGEAQAVIHINVFGPGSVTVQPNGMLWSHRIRGLSDV